MQTEPALGDEGAPEQPAPAPAPLYAYTDRELQDVIAGVEDTLHQGAASCFLPRREGMGGGGARTP